MCTRVVNDEHFPPVFVRYLAKTTGPNGPGGDKQLVTEGHDRHVPEDEPEPGDLPT